MEGFIATGEEWMTSLNEFRANLITYRDAPGMRSAFRRDGTPGHGPFTPEARKKILRELLETEAAVKVALISDEDISNIQRIWSIEFDYTHAEALGIALEFGRCVQESTATTAEDENFLEMAALEADVPQELLQALLTLTRLRAPSLELRGAKAGLERDIQNTLILAANQVEQAAP
jgi:DNA sulfur modification protein DndC